MLLVSNVKAACMTGKQCCKNPQVRKKKLIHVGGNATNNMVKAVESKVEDIHRFISKMSGSNHMFHITHQFKVLYSVDDTACLKTTNTPPSIPGSSSTTNSGGILTTK